MTCARRVSLGILICAFILTTAGTAAGLEQWIWNVGVYLGRDAVPGDICNVLDPESCKRPVRHVRHDGPLESD